jgi:hypothetical protein
MIISSDDDDIKYVPINLSDSAKSFPAYVENQNSVEFEEEDHDDLCNPVRKGFHAFVKLTSAYLRVVGRNEEAAAEPELRPIGDSFQPPYQVNAKTVVNESSVPDGKLLISIVYKLNSTRDHGEVYNCRQLYQINDEIFIYVEYGYFQPHEVKIDRDNTKILSLEGLMIFAKLSQILEDFMYWLVEVDPIGFELLRRMARDGFTNELEISEDLTWMHDSDSFMDRWFCRMTNYADSIYLSALLDGDNDRFLNYLANCVRDANTFTRTDFFMRSERQSWVHPIGRKRSEDDDFDSALGDEDDFIAAEIEQMQENANKGKKQPEKFLFKNISPTLKVLIDQMIEKMESKFDDEEIDVSIGELKRFVTGDISFTENEISDQLSRILRMLA